MFDYSKLWILLSLQIMILVIPGVSFAVIVRNSVVGGRENGILTALGLSLAISCHIAFSILGIAIIAEASPLFYIVRYAGGLYLIWMGYRFWKESSKPFAEMEESLKLPLGVIQKKSALDAIKTGFLIDILNPYIFLFHFSTFMAVLPPSIPLSHKAIYASSLVLISLAWFVFISIVFSNSKIRGMLMNYRQWTERLTTLVLVFFGCRILLY